MLLCKTLKLKRRKDTPNKWMFRSEHISLLAEKERIRQMEEERKAEEEQRRKAKKSRGGR